MLNYSALTDPLTPQDIKTFQALKPGGGLVFKIVMAVMGATIGATLILALYGAALLSDNPASLVMPTIILVVAVGGVVLAVLSAQAHSRANARLYKFATQNSANFTLQHTGLGETGVIFGEGHSRTAYSIVDFSSGLRTANYQYTTGSGKNRQTHSWSYARMSLERHVPNMMIDAKSNNLFRRFSNLPAGSKSAQIEKINAEFDNLYTLYVPENYEQDAYYLLTPDVLAALVDAKGYYDIEVVDNIIYFYSKSRIDFSKKENWDRLLSVVAPVAKELREQADYYADAKAGAPRSADIIAPEGRRLRRGVAVSTIFTFIFIVAYFIFTIVSGMR